MDQSEILKFEQQQQITKLSQAIRIGAKLRPQGFGQLWDGHGTCALGAAIEAIWGEGSIYSMPDGSRSYDDIRLLFPFADRLNIDELNDKQRLTREQIADKLEAMGY